MADLYTFDAWANPDDCGAFGWNVSIGAPTRDLMNSAVQVWSIFQNRPTSVDEAAKTFNCEASKIIDCIGNHPWMYLEGPRDDLAKLMIEHEGESDIKPPPGIIASFTDETGHVMATLTEFDRAVYGGLSLREAQESRAKRRISFEVMRAYCPDIVLQAFEPDDYERIVRKMVSKGCSITLVPMGHDDG